MKLFINKYIFILFCVACQMNAMNEERQEEPCMIQIADCGLILCAYSCAMLIKFAVNCIVKIEDPSIPCDDICHLNRMPVEVLDYIAYFLMESKEEFVARMYNKYDCKVCDFYRRHHLREFCPDDLNSLSTRYQYIHSYSWFTLNHNNVEYKGCIKKKEINCIALSRHMDMMGIFRFENKSTGTHTSGDVEAILEIQKIDLKKDKYGKENEIVFGQEQCLVFHVQCPTLMGFNEQGTLFMACKKNDETGKWSQYIYSLKKNVLSKIEDDIKISNKLQQYFRDNRVCNKYIKGAGK